MADRLRHTVDLSWGSAAPYVSVLAVGVVLARFMQYLWPHSVLFKGQAPAIFLNFAVFAVAGVLWLRLRNRQRAKGPLAWFLIAMSVAWVTHMFLTILHGDLFNHTAWLYAPILLMLFLKPPSAKEGWVALSSFAWALSLVLVLSRLLEIAGIMPIMYVEQWIIDLEKSSYWLPFSGYLGLDGRWPGPFGHNGHTAMMGALLVVIAVARLSKSSPVFFIVGVLTLLLTGGRASVGAAVVGIVVVVVFTRSGTMGKLPTWARISGGLAFVAIAAIAMFAGDAGSSGRQAIWPAFFDLWKTSIWTGVGTSGISVSGGLTERYGHAHNLYLDELTRYGLLSFICIFTALGIGLFIVIRSAMRGLPGPLAIVAAYVVMCLTEPRNDWIHPSVTGFLVILSVVIAGSWIEEEKKPEAPVRIEKLKSSA